MKLQIRNKGDFVTNFLGSISTLNDAAVLKIEPTKISSIVSSVDATIVLSIEMNIDANGTITGNVPDLKKLARVVGCVNSEGVELDIGTNQIKHTSDSFKFKYHLLEDGIIKAPSINFNKVKELKFDTTFAVTDAELNTLFKGSSFATETNKLYLYCEDNKIFAELGDRTRHNTDNFQCCLSPKYDGVPLAKVLPFNFETFRLINFNKSNEIVFAVNQQYGVLKITLNKGDSKLIYIVSALIN